VGYLYAEENSGEQAARHFDVAPKRIRYWRKQRDELRLADKGRARLAGAGRKKVSVALEAELPEWIYTMRDKHNRVSRKMIQNKAKEIYSSVGDGAGKEFVASRGWLEIRLKRNNLSLRRCTTMAQKDPDLLTEKLVSFVDVFGKAVSAKGILEKDIIAMDETAVWFDMVSRSVIDKRGAKSVALKTTGHEKSHLTVVLAPN